jgi:hypothetical protein
MFDQLANVVLVAVGMLTVIATRRIVFAGLEIGTA